MKSKATKITLLVVTLAIVLLGGLACYFFLRGDSYTNALPAHLRALARIDAVTLIAGDDIQIEDVARLLQQGEQPTGVDLTRPVYSFVDEQGDLGMLCPLSSSDDFGKWLLSKGSPVEQQRGFSWCMFHDQWLVCYDSDKALILGPFTIDEAMNARNMVAAWMSQDRESSGVATAMYDTLQTMNGGITLVAGMDLLPQNYTETVRTLLPAGVSLSDLQLRGALNVKGGDANLEINVFSPNPTVEATLDSLDALSKPIKGELTSCTPAYPFVWMCANVEGGRLLSLLRQSPTLRTALLALNMGVDADMMIRSISGDVSVVMPEPTITKPQYVLTAQLDNEQFLQNVDDWKQGVAVDNGFRFVERGGNDYYCSTGEYDAYFGVRDHLLYVAPSESCADLACKGSAPTGLEGMVPSMNECVFYMNVDLSQVSDVLATSLLFFGVDTGTLQKVQSLERFTVSATDSRHINVGLHAKSPLLH